MRHSALCLLAILIGSCNGSSDGPSGSNGEASQWIDDIAAVLCDLTTQCCGPEGFTPPADCLTKAKTQLHRDLDKEIDAGAHFDRQAGDQCTAYYRSLAPSCPKTFDFESCHRVFSGGKPAADSCDAACPISDAGRAICGTSSSIAADGAVQNSQYCQIEITVQPGGACDNYGRMPIERHCDLSKSSNCVQGICSMLKPIGAACIGAPSTIECVPEAICTAGLCVPRVPVGGACTASECVPGAYCDGGRCTFYSKWKKFCGGDFN
jgi:hypothetical protein